MCSHSRAKSRDDIMALMHVTYTKLMPCRCSKTLNCELTYYSEGVTLTLASVHCDNLKFVLQNG